MAIETHETTSISLDLSIGLLQRLNKACEREFGEQGKRSLKLRTLIRLYCKEMEV